MPRRPRIVHTPRVAERSIDIRALPDTGALPPGGTSLRDRIGSRWRPAPPLAAEPGADAELRTPVTSARMRGATTEGLVGAMRETMREIHMENIHPLRLRLLLEIERTGSISAAAEACAIAQPSASMHVRTLETAIGQRLVTRHGRGSRLTPAGKIVASHADRVLAAFDSMRRALDVLDGRNTGELSLAASLTPSLLLLPRVLREYSARYPGVRISLQTIPSHTVVREVVRGSADIGIAGEVPTAEPVARQAILADELVGIAPPGLIRFDRGCLSLAELARHSLVMGGEASSTRIATERYLAGAGYRPARVWTFDSYDAIKRAVADGVGVSFVSQLLAHEEIERGELVAFRVLGAERMPRPIHALHSGVRELSFEGAAFMALLADAPWSPAERCEAAAAASV